MNIEAAKAVLDEMEGVSGDMYDGSLTMHEDTFHDYARRIRDALEEEPRRDAGTRTPKEALREALQTIHDRVNSLNEECGVDPVEIRDIARAALKKPWRNCERFGSYAEARAEWWKFEVLPRVAGVVSGTEQPFDEWLFATAKEQKGGE